MAAGGIYDQLAGGFARYATDPAWLVPHFEKMLYDNAQLARVYLHAWALTCDPAHLRVATATLDFVAREMTLPDGVFAASLDADTAGEEGATYTWTADEVRQILVDAGLAEAWPLVAEAYDVTEAGNWEGRVILRRVASDEGLAERHGRPPGEVAGLLERARGALLAARDRRPQPARDDKALAGWNGLALGAFADAAGLLSREDDPELGVAAARYRAIAERAAARLISVLRSPDGRFRRSWKDGQARHAGTLEDQACMGEGLLTLYEATADERWFAAAAETAEAILAHFADPAGGFHDTADDAGDARGPAPVAPGQRDSLGRGDGDHGPPAPRRAHGRWSARRCSRGCPPRRRGGAGRPPDGVRPVAGGPRLARRSGRRGGHRRRPGRSADG